jgi:FkbM family methyltransferase
VYGPFIKEGSVVFDIGAHVGSRARFFRKLGARVVAVEPQPLLAGFLRWLFLGDEGVEVLPLAVAGQPGELELAVNPTNPTVSTASAAFRAAVAAVPSFASVRWSEGIRVETTTLDRLIEQYGRPSFIKIDVEGMEDEVLAGLSMSVPALSSSSFLPIARPPCAHWIMSATSATTGSTFR